MTALPPSSQLPRRLSRAPAWVPVRTLTARHRERVIAHLLSLSDADRALRFGHLATDERVRSYGSQIDFARDQVFGIFNHKLELVAMAHLAYPNGSVDGHGGTAEFGVSVRSDARGRGFGARLFEHAVTHARNRGVHTLAIHMARDNAAMLAIVRRAGAAISFDGGDALAQLPLPADTLGSQIEALLGHQAAEFDYRLKMQVLRLNQGRSRSN